MSETAIVTRHMRLRKQVLEPSDNGLTFEGLIDALMVLYEECSQVKAKNRSQQISAFISTFQNIVHTFSKLRVNIGDFKVIRVIGRGNFADVQLAKERSTGKVYALKVMKKVGENVPSFYCEERDIMARTSSPWHTKLDYAFQDSAHLYLAMEFHCGGDLLSLLDRNNNSLDEASVRFYTAEVALGIHDLHKMGFVHRDIKPENILIDRTGHLKLADFGNAARLSTAGTVSKVMPVGTPDYIAPEVLQCLQSGEDSHGVECDYWSLGILVYEMFHGTSPFTDLEGSVINTYANIMRHAEVPVNFPEDTPKHLKSVVQGLLKPARSRLGHQQLVRHQFFSALDWSNLQNTAPPHVPQVSGADDDSNFDLVEESPPVPDIASLKPSKEFRTCFRNLPFVGFTFTSTKGKVAAGLGKADTQGLEAQLKAKAAELEKMKLKNFQLEQQALNHTRVAEGSVREFEQVEKLTTQLNMAEQDNAELKSTVKNMERILEIERQDRAATEQKTITLLEDVRRKWSRAEEERMEVVRRELSEEKERAEEGETKWREVSAQLKKCKSELEAVTGVKNQLKAKLKDYKSRLENVASMEETRAKVISKLEEEKREAEAEVSLCKSQLNETRINDGKVDALQLLVEQRDQILAEKDAEIRIKTSEVEAFAAKQEESRKKIQSQEEKLKEKAKEVASLKEELESAKNESRLEVESQLGVHAQLKSEIKDILKENAEIKSKIKATESSYFDLETKYTRLRGDLEGRCNELEKVKEERVKEITEKEVMYKEKMRNLEKVFENLQEKINTLEKKGRKESGADLKMKQIRELECNVETLEVAKAKLQNKVTEVESEKNELEKKAENYKKEMEELKKTHAADLEKSVIDRSTFAIELEDSAKLKEENEKLAAELKEVKLDLRIEKRELEKKSNLCTYIREREQKNKERLEELEKEKLDHEKEVAEMKTTVENLEKAAEEVKKKEEKMSTMSADLKKLKDEKSEVVIENRRLKTDASTHQTAMEKLAKKISKLEDERKEFASVKVNNEALQEVAGELEKQVMDFERINEKLEAKIESLQTEKRDFEGKLDAEKEETRKAKIGVNEEKSLRIHLESQLKTVKRKVEEAEETREKEKEGSERRLEEYKALCKKLSSTLEDLTNDNASKEQFGIMNERMKNNLELENKQLKEELSERITQLSSHKESNFKLTQGIEEAIHKISDKNTEIENLKLAMEAERTDIADQITRHQATQAQQGKLIDFLQTKVTALEGKKKTISDKIFGNNKENARPTGTVPMAYAELEQLLDKEKQKGKKLTQQLSRARAEVVALKTNQPEHSEIPASVLSQVDAKSHNIPHRLATITCKKVTRCVVCQESLSFMSSILQCKDCGVSVHPACAKSLPPTCGLPAQMLATMKTVPVAQRPLPPAPEACLQEGPVQALVSGSWREAHLVLAPNHMLDLYTDSSKSTRLDQIGLTLPHCRVSVQSSVAYTEVFHLSTSDRPYTFKLTMQTQGQPEKVLYLMCRSFSNKVEWVNKVEASLRTSSHNMTPPMAQLPEGASKRLVCALPPPQEVLGVVKVGKETVVGTSQGLALLTPEGLVHCKGLDTPVHSLHYLESLHLLVLATGGDGLPSQLVSISTLALSLPLTPVQVTPELATCHTFAAQESSKGKVFLCATSEDLVVIMEWSAKRGAFVLRNKFSTDQPCRAIEFTEQTVLVGTTKLYEIDLKTFSAEEFLDLTNPGVKATVASAAFQGSLPRGVMRRQCDGGDPEYLLAFTRHVLFVDSFGQQTREPLLLERFPLEQKLLGDCLIEFRPLGEDGGNISHLAVASPHLLAIDGEELLFSHQAEASNNLAGVTLSPTFV